MDTSKSEFKVGFAISVYQNSGDPNTNWGSFEQLPNSWLGIPKIANGDKCGPSCDFWHLYEEDIQRAADFGSNCFRISLEWSRIEPHHGFIDPDAVERYHRIFDLLLQKGMTPFVTLHHFVHPMWFERLGGFAKEENIKYFLEYAKTAYRLFGSKIKQWATFNEPALTSFAGFFHGSFPPGKLMNLSGMGHNLLNMLRSHTQAYAAIKSMPGGKNTTIGIVHNYFSFEPKRTWLGTPPYLTLMSNFLNKMWGNDVVLNYLKTGVFDFNPLWGFFRVHYEEPSGPPGCDMFGINYYSRAVMDWKLAATCHHEEVMTDMPYALYADGLITAIHHFSKLGVPIYITETGVADIKDERRPLMMDSYFTKIEEAVRMGYDVRGLMYWTLVDNFEWNLGYDMRFGIYEWNRGENQKRTLRASGALLKKWFARLKESVPSLREGKGVVEDDVTDREIEKPSSWSPSNFPDPKRDINACGRGGQASSLCDADSILSRAAGDRIDGIIAEIYEGQDPYARADCGDQGLLGYQIGVALLRRMDLEGQAPADAARNFAKTLHNKWGVGDAACDNGVLLFISIDDRQVYISTGKGAANALHDELLGKIINAMKPALKAQDYDAAVEQAVVDIGLAHGSHHSEEHSWDIFPIFFFGGVAFFIGKSLWASNKRRKEFKDCKAMLEKLKQEQQRLSTREWSKPKSCPICLEDFTTTDPEPGLVRGEGDDEAEPATAPLLSSTSGAGTSKSSKGGEATVDQSASGSILGVKGSSRDTNASGGVQREPMTLGCGHTFCEPCIQEWLDHATTCPICRKPIDPSAGETDRPQAPPGQQQPSGQNYRQRDRAAWEDVVAADLAFRLGTLQRRYPAFITPDMAGAWSRDMQQTGTFDWAATREFQLRDPAVRAQHEARGHSGFSTSFGGGSGGGGGAGGSW